MKLKLFMMFLFLTACFSSTGCDLGDQRVGKDTELHTKEDSKSSTIYSVEDFPRMKPCPEFASYERVHLDGAKKIPWAVAMEQRYPDIDHFITHFGMNGSLPNVWNSEVHFGGRYVLTLQVAVAIDYGNETLKVIGKPSFFLTEISAVAADGSGTYGESLDFGEVRFNQLVKSDWDYATINFLINPVSVPRFKLAKAMAQAPRYPITLLGDNNGQNGSVTPENTE